MNRISVSALSLLLAPPVLAQQFPPVPGFNIGLNPFATIHDAIYLPTGTVKVELTLIAASVYDSRACSTGSSVFFDTQTTRATFPRAITAAPGWTSVQPRGWTFGCTNPFYSSWYAGYCSMTRCTSPCEPNVVQPERMLFVFAPVFY